jgi:hypothetical protein
MVVLDLVLVIILVLHVLMAKILVYSNSTAEMLKSLCIFAIESLQHCFGLRTVKTDTRLYVK